MSGPSPPNNPPNRPVKMACFSQKSPIQPRPNLSNRVKYKRLIRSPYNSPPTSNVMTKEEKLELHKHFQFCGQNSLKWRRKCELMLPKIAEEKIWKRKGFHNIYEYAAKLAGMSKYTVDETLRVLDHIKDKPDILKVAKEKGINRVKPIAVIATK